MTLQFAKVTGERTVFNRYGDAVTVLLYDGAQAVPVYSYTDLRGWVLGDGQTDLVRVACGPAAPCPTIDDLPRPFHAVICAVQQDSPFCTCTSAQRAAMTDREAFS